MKNVIGKKVSSLTNQIIEIELYETKKLNMSTSDELAAERWFFAILTISFKFSLCVAMLLDSLCTKHKAAI